MVMHKPDSNSCQIQNILDLLEFLRGDKIQY